MDYYWQKYFIYSALMVNIINWDSKKKNQSCTIWIYQIKNYKNENLLNQCNLNSLYQQHIKEYKQMVKCKKQWYPTSIYFYYNIILSIFFLSKPLFFLKQPPDCSNLNSKYMLSQCSFFIFRHIYLNFFAID